VVQVIAPTLEVQEELVQQAVQQDMGMVQAVRLQYRASRGLYLLYFR
jgi:hypothetical protein